MFRTYSTMIKTTVLVLEPVLLALRQLAVKLSVVLLSIITLASTSCASYDDAVLSNHDRENFLMSQDKINKPDVYDEPEHLQERLNDADPTVRDLAAERLVILDSRRANKLIRQTIEGYNNDAAKLSILKALAKYKINRFTEEVIILLETSAPLIEEQLNLQPEIFAVLRNNNSDSLSKMLLKHLNQPDKPESMRQNLVRGLAYAPSKRSIPFLIGLLTNRKSDFNTEIINTLSVITRQDFIAKEDWNKWWESSRNQPRDKWLEQIINDYHDEIQKKDELIEKYSKIVSELRVEVLKLRLEQIRRLGDSNVELALLNEGMDSEFMAVKKFAVEQIKSMEQEKAKQLVPKLIELFNAYAPKANNPNGVMELNNEDLRLGILAILSNINDERILEPLLTVVNNPKELITVKQKAIIALGKTKNPKILLNLLNIIDAESPEIVLVITEVFATFGTDAKITVDKLHNILNNKRYQDDEKLIKSVLDTLGDIKEISSIAIIMPYLNDSRSRVRWSAVNSLGDIIPTPAERENIKEQPDLKRVNDLIKKATEQMERLLNDEFLDVRQITITALGKIGEKSAGASLIRILTNDKDARTRQLATEAIGKINDRTSLPFLLTALSESDETLSTAIWTAVQSIASNNVDLMEEIADKLRQSNQLSYAVLMLKKIIALPKLQGDESEARRLSNEGVLGLILTQKGEYNQAIIHLQNAEKKFADKHEFTLARIECHKKLQNYELAAKSCSELLKDQQAETALWWKLKMNLLDIYILQKDYSKASSELNNLLNKPSLTPDVKVKLDKIKEDVAKNLPPTPPPQPPAPK